MKAEESVAVGVQYKPAAFHCGLFQVYVTGRKYALPRGRDDHMIS